MTQTAVNAGPKLDRPPMSPWHRKVVALVAAGIFIALFELYSSGSILAALMQSGWSSVAINARFLAVTFAGLSLGAWLAGVAGDGLGRRFCYRALAAMLLLQAAVVGLFGAEARRKPLDGVAKGAPFANPTGAVVNLQAAR